MVPILKLWLKQDPWHITTDDGEQNLILFMQEDDGRIRNLVIPMTDILDWDLEYESAPIGLERVPKDLLKKDGSD